MNGLPMVSQLTRIGLDGSTIKALIGQHIRIQSMCGVIRMMCESAEEGQFNKLAGLLSERQSIMDSIANEQQQLKPRIQEAGCSDQVNELFAPFLKAVENGDEVLLKILRLKKGLHR